MRGGQSVADNAMSVGGVESGHAYVEGQYGDGNTQWNNVFGPESTSIMGNEIVNLQHPQEVAAMLYPQTGGRRRARRSRRVRRRGGNLVTAASVTPFALWGMQRMYSRKTKPQKYTKSKRRR
jgi:hypothetical protein